MSNGIQDYIHEAEAFTKAFMEGEAQRSEQARARGLDPLALGGSVGYQAFNLGLLIQNPLNIPAWGTRRRDIFLRDAFRNSTVFSSVVYGETARVVNAEYTLTSENKDKDDLVKYQDMFNSCDFGNGFDTFRSKLVQDLLSQDNGGFIELIGDNRSSEQPLEGAVKSFAHIDSAQCFRTFNLEYPVLYFDPLFGDFKIFHWTRVISISSMPSAIELARNIGLSAMSRAYEAGRIIVNTNQYVYEKVTGGAPDIYISNQPVKQFDKAVLDANLQQLGHDYQVFRNPILMSPRSGGVGANDFNITTLPLKTMPDGFDHHSEVTIGWYMVAAGFGVDAREYWPATSSGATKADAEVQDLKGESKGRAEIMNMIENAFNWRILPADVTMEFRRKNALTDRHEAENKLIRVDARAKQILSGELSLEEARQMAALDGDIDPAFLEEASTTDATANPESLEQETEGGELPDADADGIKALMLATKDYGALRARFSSQLFTVINRLRRQQNDISGFFIEASDLLYTMGQRAFLQGMADGGAPVANVGSMEQSERNIMAVEINNQVGFLSNLSNTFTDPDTAYAEIRDRVGLWANKGLDGIYYAGVMAGRANPNMLWEIGATEKSCNDCLNMNGRVYRKNTWAKYDIVPRSSQLGCKGFKCDCTLSETMEPVTPGRPPKLTGT